MTTLEATRTWRIEDQDGNVWLQDNALTGAVAISVCTVLERDSWDAIDPTRSPFALTGLLVVLFAQRFGCDLQEATAVVMMQPMTDLLNMLKIDYI
jgi:hypothetical protein